MTIYDSIWLFWYRLRFRTPTLGIRDRFIVFLNMLPVSIQYRQMWRRRFLNILCINTKNAFGTALESSPRLFIFKQHCSTSEIIPQHSQKLGLYFLNVNYNQDSSAHLKKKCCDNIILQKTYFKISWQHISVSVNVLRAFSKRLFDTEGIYDKTKTVTVKFREKLQSL